MVSTAAALAGLIGRCPAMERLKKDLVLLGRSDERVHVFGETGTGKELVAKALHAESPRARRPLVPVNVAGLSDDLLISELFGHARGAFTGAATDHEGYVATAEGGTLFIDELGDLSGVAQVRLLRFLEEGEYQRLGETAVRRADVRVVSATHVDIPRRVREGRFREDLWFRFKVEGLHVPPLRERGDDVLLLARHFLHQHAAGRGEPPATLSREAEAALLAHAWPGNVRELRNEMHRVAVRASGRAAGIEDLSPELQERKGRRAGTLRENVRRYEAGIILDALERHHGNVARTAAELGMTRQALWDRTRRLRIEAESA
jgi:DNA-binding NtrC family response regulator